MLANCCARNYTPVEKLGLRTTSTLEFSDFRIFNSVFVHTTYTFNMAACYATTSVT